MSQIRNDNIMNVDHYQSNSLVQKQEAGEVPAELRNARPVSGSSGWKTAGRVALGIMTCGLSELFRLAYLGIKACCSSSRPAPAREARVPAGAGKGLPKAGPDAAKHNTALASAILGKSEFAPEYKTTIDEMMDDLRGKYGSDLIPEGKSLAEVLGSVPKEIDPNIKRNVFCGVRDSKDAVSPGDLQNIIRQNLVPALNLMVLTAEAKAKAAQIGGMGGLSMESVVKNMLCAPGLKARLNAIDGKAGVLEFAKSIGVQQKLAGYRTAMQNAVAELRALYGADRIPEDLDAAMSLKIRTGQTMKNMLDAKFEPTDPSVVDAMEMQEYIKEELASPAQHMAVEKALSSKAQAMGITLSRRAEVLLANALLENPANKTAMDAAADPETLQNAIDGMELDAVLQTQKEKVETLYGMYASQVPPESRALLRAFIEGCPFAPSTAAASEALVKGMAGHMKEWKNLDGSEQVRQPLNDVFKETFSSDLQKLQDAPGESSKYTDNIYNTMLVDSNRNEFNINGTDIRGLNKKNNVTSQEITTALKNAVPDPKDQQMLSKLMNQRMWANMMITATVGMLPNGTMLDGLPGGNTLPSTPPGNKPMLQDLEGNPATFAVTVSPDKKTARVTATMTQQINFLGSMQIDGKMPGIGVVKLTFDFQLNLSAHEQGQGVTDLRIGQEIVPFDRLN